MPVPVPVPLPVPVVVSGYIVQPICKPTGTARSASAELPLHGHVL